MKLLTILTAVLCAFTLNSFFSDALAQRAADMNLIEKYNKFAGDYCKNLTKLLAAEFKSRSFTDTATVVVATIGQKCDHVKTKQKVSPQVLNFLRNYKYPSSGAYMSMMITVRINDGVPVCSPTSGSDDT
jgi:hypothetical protein